MKITDTVPQNDLFVQTLWIIRKFGLILKNIKQPNRTKSDYGMLVS